MATELFQVLTGDLMLNMERTFRNNVESFPGLISSNIKVGFLGEVDFPAISIIPVSWQLVKWQSGGRYQGQRIILIRFYSSGVQIGDAERRARENVDRLTTLIVNEDKAFYFRDIQHQPSSFNYSIEGISYLDIPERLNDRLVVEATVQLLLTSYDYRPTQNSKTNFNVEANSTDLLQAVWERLYANRGSRLGMLEEWHINSLLQPPQGHSLTLYMNSVAPQRYAYGADMFDHTFNARLRSLMFPDSASLVANANIADMVRYILDEDETFGGRMFDSEVNSIVYGQSESEDEPTFYDTVVTMVGRQMRSNKFLETVAQ